MIHESAQKSAYFVFLLWEIHVVYCLKFEVGDEGMSNHRLYNPLIQILIIQWPDFCFAMNDY